MSGGFNMDDYVDVAERIRSFYERFEDGRLTSEPPYLLEIGGKPFICVHAKAYRTPDDQLPGDGLAWEPVPGPTQFTRDSELMNAQTAAWGRAIVALGFETKKIASAQEVRARNGDAAASDFRPPANTARPAGDPLTGAQAALVEKLLDKLHYTAEQRTEIGPIADLSKAAASMLIARLKDEETAAA